MGRDGVLTHGRGRERCPCPHLCSASRGRALLHVGLATLWLATGRALVEKLTLIIAGLAGKLTLRAAPPMRSTRN
jgi:hypothetical protein